ncbi:MAG: hypothetical protein A2066_02355 [Bacteroidetes bacterium GWB2_41_8]|nr:MAG: hypothetical protein A2066_02355 [Bacteroidetes bacterium GWB2_41_8]
MLRNKLILFILLVLPVISAFSQTAPATWLELEFSKKIVKNLKVEFNPELRLASGFEMDSYIFEGGLSYKLNEYLTIAGYYRFENEYNYREKRKIYEWESSNRLAFDAKSGFNLDRFDIQIRLRYTNGADFDQTTSDKASYFRYRTKLDYDIKGSKLVPFISAEVFHDLILKGVEKSRYTGGLAYPINKSNEISIYYRLQDYTDAKTSLNILGLGYSLKF